MNRYSLIICLLVILWTDCPYVSGQYVTDRPIVPEPVALPKEMLPAGQNFVNEHAGMPQSQLATHNLPAGAHFNPGATVHHSTIPEPATVIVSTVEVPSVIQLHQHPHQNAYHAAEIHSGARIGQIQMSYSLHRASDNIRCPLKLLHVPYGVWIEIEGTWYQHKSLDNTMDVCVNFEIVPSSFQPSIVIRTASNPSDIRQSETSMSKSILLVPGQTVEFDYARDFGEQLRKKPSNSERASIARMSHAESETTHFIRMASAPILANRELRPDQISSIQVDQFATDLTLSARASVWDVSPTTGTLFTLRASTRLLSSLSPNVRVKADIKTSYTNSANETISKSFVAQIEGELGRGRVSDTNSNNAQIECIFDFNQLFNSDSELSKYILSARNGGRVECYFTNVKLEFYNSRFGKAITNSIDGLSLQPFKLRLDLKFPK